MRICESGAPECTGVNPCTSCFKRITTIVMPIAMRAGGIASDRAKSAAFFKEYGNGWQWMLSEVSKIVVAKMQAMPSPGMPTQHAQQPGFPGTLTGDVEGAYPPPNTSMGNVAPIRPRDREETRDVTARPARNVKPVDRGASRIPEKKKGIERGEIKKMAREQAETPPTVEESGGSDLSSTVSPEVLDLADPALDGTSGDTGGKEKK